MAGKKSHFQLFTHLHFRAIGTGNQDKSGSQSLPGILSPQTIEELGFLFVQLIPFPSTEKKNLCVSNLPFSTLSYYDIRKGSFRSSFFFYRKSLKRTSRHKMLPSFDSGRALEFWRPESRRRMFLWCYENDENKNKKLICHDWQSAARSVRSADQKFTTSWWKSMRESGVRRDIRIK